MQVVLERIGDIMSEDVSAFIRLAVTVSLVAATIVSSLIVVAVAVNVFSNWKSDTVAVISNAVNSSSIYLLNQTNLTAPDIFRLIDDSVGKIYVITIVPRVGTTISANFRSSTAESDFEKVQDWCLKNADKNFVVSYTVVVSEGTDMYNITLTEVSN